MGSVHGITNIAKRSDLLLSSLVNGTLAIEVRMKLAKLTQDKEEDCCVICMSTKKTHEFIPCGHMCLCEGCAALIERSDGENRKQCPICRTESVQIMKVFH